MFKPETVNFIDLRLLDCQVEMILDALQLYAYNFHRVWPVNYDNKLEETRNSFIYYTYSQIQAKYNLCGFAGKDYNVLKECEILAKRKDYRNYLLKKDKYKIY